MQILPDHILRQADLVLVAAVDDTGHGEAVGDGLAAWPAV
jgi:hypothetical protein